MDAQQPSLFDDLLPETVESTSGEPSEECATTPEAADTPDQPPPPDTPPAPSRSRAKPKKVTRPIPALPAQPGALSDDALIEEWDRLQREAPILDEAHPAGELEAFQQGQAQLMRLLIERALMVYGGDPADMRARADLKARGEPLPDIASCGDARFPDPLPTLPRACRHVAVMVSHLDGKPTRSLDHYEIEYIRTTHHEAADMAEAAGEGASFRRLPLPWCHPSGVVATSPYRDRAASEDLHIAEHA